MFDFKKIVEVTKRAVCFLLSGIMALNSFSVFADEEKGQITLIGDKESGKTALLKKLMGGEFSEEYNETKLPDFQTLTTKTGETIATTCDTSGDENSSMFFVREPYFTNSTVLLLVIPYNTTDCSQYLKKWVDWLGSDIDKIEKVKIIITKKEEDLEGRNATLNDQIKTYISEAHNTKIDEEIIEMSSKTGYGIDALKEYLEKSFQPSAIAGLEAFDTWPSQSMHDRITEDVNPLQLAPVNSTANDSQITDKPQETASVDGAQQMSTLQVNPGTDVKPLQLSPINSTPPALNKPVYMHPQITDKPQETASVDDTRQMSTLQVNPRTDVNPLQLAPINSTPPALDKPVYMHPQITDKPQETASLDDAQQMSTSSVNLGTDDKPTETKPSNKDSNAPKNSQNKKKWWIIGGGIGAFFVTVGTTATILIKKFQIDLKALFNKHLGHIFKI